MNRRIVCLVTGCLMIVVAGCASTGQNQEHRDFELFVEGQELENITSDPEFGSGFDVSAERDRLGVRLAFGPEKIRGFVQVFREDWKFTDLPNGRPGAKYENWGIGGGVKGAPVVGKIGESVSMIIPYRGDISYVWGENADDPEWEMIYFDICGEAAFGIDWMGLRPSVGLAFSAVGGVLSGYGIDNDFSGGNVGLFLDLMYKHPEFPLYGHIRAMGGEYRMLTLGIGVKF